MKEDDIWGKKRSLERCKRGFEVQEAYRPPPSHHPRVDLPSKYRSGQPGTEPRKVIAGNGAGPKLNQLFSPCDVAVAYEQLGKSFSPKKGGPGEMKVVNRIHQFEVEEVV